jgi:hypothetical protein
MKPNPLPQGSITVVGFLLVLGTVHLALDAGFPASLFVRLRNPYCLFLAGVEEEGKYERISFRSPLAVDGIPRPRRAVLS